jgi:hypothetical protein
VPAPLDQYASQSIRFGVSGGEDLEVDSVSFSTSGSNVIVAAQAGRIIRIYGLVAVLNTASNIQLNQSTSAFTGTMSMLAGSSITLTPNTRPYFLCDAGNPFRINSSVVSQISGSVWYRVDDVPPTVS